MAEKNEFPQEIQSLKNKIKSLENLVLELIKLLEVEKINFQKKNKHVLETLEKNKNYQELKEKLPNNFQKNEKENKDDEKYDWIEDTI
tara:strand:- start:254 stop:517 length:264 start_codon:yes stop_codon:yes gene_type:complete